MKSKSLHRSPLFDLYPDDPPLMEFGGWEMPRDFGGIVREHRAVREDCGVFDLSHMGRLVLRGDTALEEASRLFTRSCEKAENGQALYGFFCDEDGGCIDDAILYRKSADEVWMVVNAANRERVVDWIEEHRESATLEDRTFDTVLLAVQGPNAPERIDEVVDVIAHSCDDIKIVTDVNQRGGLPLAKEHVAGERVNVGREISEHTQPAWSGGLDLLFSDDFSAGDNATHRAMCDEQQCGDRK